MVLALGLTSCCDDDEPFITATEDDSPRILQPWFGEWSNGVPGDYKSFPRNINFKDSVTVTPADYTTVQWFLDDELINTGTHIDQPLVAGEYILKIVATTTKGKSTSRQGKITVTPVDGDPVIDESAKARHMMPGTEKTVAVENIDDVAKVYIGKQQASDVSFANGKLTFTVPAMAEGSYPIVIEEANGQKWGCGKVNISNEEYQEPGEKTIYNGDGKQIQWGDSNIDATDILNGALKPGQKLRVFFNIEDMPDGYHAIRIITRDWNEEKDYLAQVNDIQNIADAMLSSM